MSMATECSFEDLSQGSAPQTGHSWPVKVTVYRQGEEDASRAEHIFGYDGLGQFTVELNNDGASVNGQQVSFKDSAPAQPSSAGGSAGSLHHVSEQAAYRSLVDSESLTVVDFFATWCGPCVAIAPAFERMAGTYSDVQFVKVDVDNNSTGDQVQCMPTFKFYKGGQILKTIEGADEQGLENAIKALV